MPADAWHAFSQEGSSSPLVSGVQTPEIHPPALGCVAQREQSLPCRSSKAESQLLARLLAARNKQHKSSAGSRARSFPVPLMALRGEDRLHSHLQGLALPAKLSLSDYNSNYNNVLQEDLQYLYWQPKEFAQAKSNSSHDFLLSGKAARKHHTDTVPQCSPPLQGKVASGKLLPDSPIILQL